MSVFTQEQITDLLDNVLGVKHRQWKRDTIMLCCPIHVESHESCGINIDFVPEDSNESLCIFNCLACHASGNMSWLLFKSLPDDFKNLKQADAFLSERYGVDVNSTLDLKGLKLKRYEDHQKLPPEREVIPLSKIAPFKSGKETYEYFYSRGFTSQVVKDFMIGRDLENETVTVPIFYEDRKLAGVIGRFIDQSRPHNERFKIYDFKKGNLLFPLDHFKNNGKNEIILVEGLFDAIRMHQLGYHNTLTTFTNSITRLQAKQVRERADKIILMCDNDAMGRIGEAKIRKALSDLTIRSVVYPPLGKDPCDWTEEEIREMMNHTVGVITKPLNRL